MWENEDIFALYLLSLSTIFSVGLLQLFLTVALFIENYEIDLYLLAIPVISLFIFGYVHLNYAIKKYPVDIFFKSILAITAGSIMVITIILIYSPQEMGQIIFLNILALVSMFVISAILKNKQ